MNRSSEQQAQRCTELAGREKCAMSLESQGDESESIIRLLDIYLRSESPPALQASASESSTRRHPLES
jgi:hypothetical protein